VQLAVPHVERDHPPRAALEEAVGEPAGRGAEVEAVEAGGIDAERVEGVGELLAAARDEPGRALDLDHGVLRHLLPRLLVPGDEPGEDERLRLRTALGEAALHEQDVQALPHVPLVTASLADADREPVHEFGEDLYMLKLDSTGTAVWGQTLEAVDSGGFINMRGVEANANGVYFAFSYYLPLVVNGTPLPHEGDFYWLAITRVDPATGVVGDYTAFGSASGGQDFSQLKSDGENNLVVSGFFDSDSGFAVQSIPLGGHGSQDGFVAKLDADLDVVWANDIGGSSADRAFNLFVSASNGIYVGGGFDSLSALSYGSTQILDSRIPSSLSMYELYVDRDGNFDSALGLYGEAAGLRGKGGGTVLSNARSVALPDGSVYSVGNFNGTVQFTPGDEVSTLHNTGFFMKWADALPAVSDCIFADGFEAGGAGCGGLGM